MVRHVPRGNREKERKWVEAHGAAFRSFVDAHPDVLQMWQNEPDAAVFEVEKALGLGE